jgi:hypothetical protein
MCADFHERGGRRRDVRGYPAMQHSDTNFQKPQNKATFRSELNIDTTQVKLPLIYRKTKNPNDPLKGGFSGGGRVQNFQGEGVLTVTRSRGGGEHPLDPNQSI